MTNQASKKGHGQKYTRKKDVAIMALITEPTMTAAAEKAGVSMSSLSRWLQEEEFQEQYRWAKNETVSHVTTRLRQSMTNAVDALNEICLNSKASPMARSNAARTLLEYGYKSHEIEEGQAILERVEERLKEDNQKGWG